VRDAGEAAFLLQANGEAAKNIFSQNSGGALPFVTQSFQSYGRINQNDEAFRDPVFTERIRNLHEAGADGAECVHTELHFDQCIADTGKRALLRWLSSWRHLPTASCSSGTVAPKQFPRGFRRRSNFAENSPLTIFILGVSV